MSHMWLLLRLCLPFCVTCLVSHTHTHTHTHTHNTCCVGFNFRTVWHTSCQTHTHTHTHTPKHTHTHLFCRLRGLRCVTCLLSHTHEHTHTHHTYSHTLAVETPPSVLCDMPPVTHARTHTHTHLLRSLYLPRCVTCLISHCRGGYWRP